MGYIYCKKGGDELKILSICIPTYNRADILNKTLEHLANEIIGIEGLIEICISDNCSSDDTQKIVEKWKKKIPLVYGKNKINQGYDQNVLAASMLATGTYIWYMGDDDTTTKGAVKKLILDLSKNNSLDMKAVYINGLSKGRWMTVCNFNGFKVFKKEQIKIKPNISFNGCICIRRDEAINIIINRIEIRDGMLFKKDYNNYLLHDFAHSYLFFECLKNSQYIGVAADYGVIAIADRDKMSYKKKLYLGLLITKYVLEIKKYYPWLNEAELIVNSPVRVIGRTYLNSCLVTEDKDLYYLYTAYLKVLKKILKDEGRILELLIINLYETLRITPIISNCLLLPFTYIKSRLPFEKRREDSEFLLKSEQYALNQIEELIDE